MILQELFIDKMHTQLGKEIGRGGYGIVYEHPSNANMCIKKSIKKGSCRVWSNEYAKIKTIETNLGSKINIGRVHLLVPASFHETENECYMKMHRIHNPLHVTQTLHPLLGEKKFNHVDKKRGIFKGLKQLKQELYMTDEILEEISYELGKMMATIHFIGKNDAYDVEVFLGCKAMCTGNVNKLGLYLADFDLSEPIVHYDKETISRMVWSLDAVPYFPTQDSSVDLYTRFKSGYTKAAGIANKHIVDQIFDIYK
jgi:hypothetical protein